MRNAERKARRGKNSKDVGGEPGREADPQGRLPVRWAVIGLAAGAAGAVCFAAGGPAAAVLAATAVASALHVMLA